MVQIQIKVKLKLHENRVFLFFWFFLQSKYVIFMACLGHGIGLCLFMARLGHVDSSKLKLKSN